MPEPAAPADQTLSLQRGRIRLCLTWTFLGRDLAVTLAGGDQPHIGAVAVSQPRPSLAEGGGPSASTSVITLLGHKEDDLARSIAARLAAHTGAVVSVACGIHLDRALPAELAEILAMADALAGELAGRLTAP